VRFNSKSAHVIIYIYTKGSEASSKDATSITYLHMFKGGDDKRCVVI